MGVTLYGLKNCDTCKKARKWLDRFGVAHVFVDYRDDKPSPETLVEWADKVGGFDALLEILAQDMGDPFAQLCATHLLVSAPARINPILPGHRNHCDEAILKVQEWIETHYARAITIEDMGREAGMAERTLKRRFRLATQLSPNVYVQKVRVDKAKKLLLATDMSIKAIAYEVGYENVSFFVRVFKTQAGQPPAQWRRSEVAGE